MKSKLSRCTLDILKIFQSRGFLQQTVQEVTEMEPGEFDRINMMKLLRKDHRNNSRKK